MIRWLAALSAALVLSGCVTERVVYRDRYVDGNYADSRVYNDTGYYDDRYVGDGSYYSPSYSGRGDYYYGSSSYYSYDSYPSLYWDYPAYYSVFWPMYRSWYDPYWYPSYYYGVTYYPRNYFSLSVHSGWGWPRYSSLYYSPYRYSWVDNYYDWTPWHGYHSRHRDRYQAPRYGSARNEAERLSRLSDRNFGGYGASGTAHGGRRDTTRDTGFGRYGTARDGSRGADYGSQPAPRQLPNERGFGVTRGSDDRGSAGDVRRNAAYGAQSSANRQQPATRGFGVPVDSRQSPQREAGYGQASSRTLPPTRGFGVTPSREPATGATREASRYSDSIELPRTRTNPGYAPRRAETPVAREYSRPATPARGYEISPAPQRDYRSAPREAYTPQPGARTYAPQPEARSYSAPSRSYDRSAGYEAQRVEPRAQPQFEARSAPSYAPRETPRYESRPQPSYTPRETPRYESRPEPRSESRSDSSRDEVRRVGSNRDER